ncbi:MAG: maleylacetoacetate isomerase [Xanthomonadales bacterium]|nr:maleylacetoacetate isomerase [Xanthomonadales bacterium]
MEKKLYTYWRSSGAYRVRIALNLKNLSYESIPINLVEAEHQTEDFLLRNPQGMVPVLTDGGRTFRQSMAIVEYLEEAYPEPPIMPAEIRARVRVRGLAHAIGCDIHPINNLRVLNYLRDELGLSEEKVKAWVQHWINTGFEAFEALLDESPTTGDFCEGDDPSLADICLVPQVYNAIRYEVSLKPYPSLRRIYANCMAEEAFHRAAPEQQPDAP